MITLGQTAYQPSTRMPPTSGRWAGWDWSSLYQAVLTAIQYPVNTLNYVRALDYVRNLPNIMVFNYPILLAAWVRFCKLYPAHNHAAAIRYMEALLRATGRFQDTAGKSKWWMIEQEWQSLEGAAPQVRGLSGFPFGAAGRTRIVQYYPGRATPPRAPRGYQWRRSGTRQVMVKLPRPAPRSYSPASRPMLPQPRGYRPRKLSVRKPVVRRPARKVTVRPTVARRRVARPARAVRRRIERRTAPRPVRYAWLTWPVTPRRVTAPRPPAMPEPQPPPMPAGLGQTLPYLPEEYPGKIILPVIIPTTPSLYPGPPTQLRKSHKWLAWIGFLGLLLLHKEPAAGPLLSGTAIKKNGLGSKKFTPGQVIEINYPKRIVTYRNLQYTRKPETKRFTVIKQRGDILYIENEWGTRGHINIKKFEYPITVLEKQGLIGYVATPKERRAGMKLMYFLKLKRRRKPVSIGKDSFDYWKGRTHEATVYATYAYSAAHGREMIVKGEVKPYTGEIHRPEEAHLRAEKGKIKPLYTMTHTEVVNTPFETRVELPSYIAWMIDKSKPDEYNYQRQFRGKLPYKMRRNLYSWLLKNTDGVKAGRHEGQFSLKLKEGTLSFYIPGDPYAQVRLWIDRYSLWRDAVSTQMDQGIPLRREVVSEYSKHIDDIKRMLSERPSSPEAPEMRAELSRMESSLSVYEGKLQRAREIREKARREVQEELRKPEPVPPPAPARIPEAEQLTLFGLEGDIMTCSEWKIVKDSKGEEVVRCSQYRAKCHPTEACIYISPRKPITAKQRRRMEEAKAKRKPLPPDIAKSFQQVKEHYIKEVLPHSMSFPRVLENEIRRKLFFDNVKKFPDPLKADKILKPHMDDLVAELKAEFMIMAKSSEVVETRRILEEEEFSKREQMVIAAMAGKAMSLDQIYEKTGLPIEKLSETLKNLETKGFINREPGKIYKPSFFGIGALRRFNSAPQLSDPSPMMSKDWIAAQIRRAVDEDPGRRVHGDTRYNAFFITPEREIVPFDRINELRRTDPAMDTISVHSHSGTNWRQYISRTGNLEPFNPLNDMDVKAFQHMVLHGMANTDVLIMADGRMEILHVPPESQDRFTALHPQSFRTLNPTHEQYTTVWAREGKQRHEVDRDRLKRFAERHGLVYLPDERWLPESPELPFVKEKYPGIRKTFTEKPIKRTKTKSYYISPYYVEPGRYPVIPEQIELWRERPPVQQRLLGRDK